MLLLAIELLDNSNKRTAAHELGHTGGLPHQTSEDKRDNLMMQAVRVQRFKGDYSKSTNLKLLRS
ncbi:MAG: hypothetical protein H6Q13_2893 [Bacteroidetes bacterium]|nr:hypothetical protein [Bacteroidota bacterium]